MKKSNSVFSSDLLKLKRKATNVKSPKRVNSSESFFDNLITMDQLLDRLKGKLKRQTIYNYNVKGLPHEYIGGKLMYSYPEVVSWLMERRRK